MADAVDKITAPTFPLERANRPPGEKRKRDRNNPQQKSGKESPSPSPKPDDGDKGVQINVWA